MKLAQGTYLNFFSEIGYDNYNLKKSYDIFIIFPEYMSEDEVLEIQEVIEKNIEKELTEYSVKENDEVCADEVKEIIKKITIDYDAQVIVRTF